MDPDVLKIFDGASATSIVALFATLAGWAVLRYLKRRDEGAEKMTQVFLADLKGRDEVIERLANQFIEDQKRRDELMVRLAEQHDETQRQTAEITRQSLAESTAALRETNQALGSNQEAMKGFVDIMTEIREGRRESRR